MLEYTVKNKDCLEWIYGRACFGYGIVQSEGRSQVAHRVSYKKYVGKIGKGLFVLHRCDNPPCINPKHLFLGTNMDNMQDKMRKGRLRVLFGENHPMAKVKNVDIIKMRKDYANAKFTLEELARIYKLSPLTVRDIIKRKRWKHLK